MATNGNANAVPFIRNSNSLEKRIKDSMILWYDLKKQAATNESMAENPVLRDLSGNGHDATCYNFAWSKMSGIGGYNPNFLTEGFTCDWSKYYQVIMNKKDEIITVTFDVKGIKEGTTLFIRSSNFNTHEGNHLSITRDGTYSFSNVAGGDITFYNYSSGTEINNPQQDTPITVTIHPLYPNALVSDGVDDYVKTGNITIPNNKFTILFDVDWLNTVDVNVGIVKSLSWWIYDKSSTNKLAVLIKNGRNSIIVSNDIFGLSSNGNIYHIDSSITEYPYDMNATGESNAINFVTNTSNTLFTKIALRKFILFNRELTQEEIEWVKHNLIEGDTKL